MSELLCTLSWMPLLIQFWRNYIYTISGNCCEVLCSVTATGGYGKLIFGIGTKLQIVSSEYILHGFCYSFSWLFVIVIL